MNYFDHWQKSQQKKAIKTRLFLSYTSNVVILELV